MKTFKATSVILISYLLAASFPTPAVGQNRVAQIRKQIATRFGETVETHYDQPYAGNTNPRQMVDVYLPKKRADQKPLPVVVYIHGGGWRAGNRHRYGRQAAALVSSGNYAAVSVSYRLSQEAKWPTQIHDCKAAIRWIRGQAKRWNLDSDRIGATGGSAGGHLVLMLGLTAGDKELEGTLGKFTNLSSSIACVVNFCGPSDLAAPLMQGKAALRDDPAVAGLIGGSLKEKAAAVKSASPLTYVNKRAVPIMTVHGTKDLRVNFNNGQRLDAALKKLGCNSLLIPITNAGHGIPMSAELAGRVQQFWDLHLRQVKSSISTEPIAAPARPKPVKKK